VRSLWAWTALAVVVMVTAAMLIGFASMQPTRVWTFQYRVVGTAEWRDWRHYSNNGDCEQARRFMKNLEDGQQRRLVETRHCAERLNPALSEPPTPGRRR
jgi:hypothetical protein